MKPFFKTSIYIFAFAFAGILFQIACSNSDDSKQILTQTGKVIYFKIHLGELQELWTCDYDGTNQSEVPVVLPSNLSFSGGNSNSASAKISPDGQKAFFIVSDNTTGGLSIYSCDIDGSNLQPVVVTTPPNSLEIGGVN